MRKIILMIFLLAGLTYGQVNIPVITGTVDFYADSISETITLDKNAFLGAFYVPNSRTLTLTFQAYNTDLAAWYNVYEDGAAYTITVDSTINCYAPVKPVVFYTAKKVRVLLDNDIADTLALPFDKRPY